MSHETFQAIAMTRGRERPGELDAEHIETTTLYELTPLGRSLDEPLAAFDRWVEANWERTDWCAQICVRTAHGVSRSF